MENDCLPDALRVLVVEDEALIGLLLEDMILELGGTFVGPFVSLATALEAVQQDNFDVALIDMNLGGEKADDVARALAARRLPFALVSGHPDVDTGLGQTAMLQKPFGMDDIAAVLNRMSQARGHDAG